MPKNARNSSPRKPKKRPLLKDGRIGQTTLLSSPDEAVDIDDPNYIVSNAKEFAALAIEAHFEKIVPFCVAEYLKPISLSPNDVARIIAEADMPLRGHADKPRSELDIPQGEKWEIDSDWGFCKVGHLLTCKFDDAGDLVRTGVWMRSSNATKSEASRVRILASSDERRISSEDVLAAMSSLLVAFGPLRFSLTNDASAHVLTQLAILRHGAHALAENLRHPHARILRRVWSHGAEALCEQLVLDIKYIEKMLADAKTERARVKLMGPMSAAFYILFGVLATDTTTAFTRFGGAFFKTVGCPCRLNTVKSALREWVKTQGSAIKRP